MGDPGEDFGGYVEHMMAVEAEAARHAQMLHEHEVRLFSSKVCPFFLVKQSPDAQESFSSFDSATDLETDNMGGMGSSTNTGTEPTFKAICTCGIGNDAG